MSRGCVGVDHDQRIPSLSSRHPDARKAVPVDEDLVLRNRPPFADDVENGAVLVADDQRDQSRARLRPRPARARTPQAEPHRRCGGVKRRRPPEPRSVRPPDSARNHQQAAPRGAEQIEEVHALDAVDRLRDRQRHRPSRTEQTEPPRRNTPLPAGARCRQDGPAATRSRPARSSQLRKASCGAVPAPRCGT